MLQKNSIFTLILSELSIIFLFSMCTSQSMVDHFNKYASNPESKPEEVIKTLEIISGMRIADIGAGGGFYTLKFAKSVENNGKLYAVDINGEYLKIIKANAEKENIKNIEYIIAKEDDSMLPDNSVDLIFIRDVFHDFDNPVEYFKRLIPKLKKSGRIAIIDYKPSSLFMGHTVSEEKIILSLEKAGYVLLKKYDFLKDQSFTIYGTKK